MWLNARNVGADNVSLVAALIAFALLGTTGAGAPLQSTNPRLAFEAASVKLQSQQLASLDSLSPLAVMELGPEMRFAGTDRFTARNATVRWLIQRAYGPEYRHSDQIVGGPQWIHQDWYEIQARAASPLPASEGPGLPAVAAEMLRSLLQDRFKLRVRQEMRELPVYALVRAREDGRLGSGIRSSAVDCTTRGGRECFPAKGSGSIAFVGVPLEAVLFPLIQGRLGRILINETGVSGNVDVDLVLPTGGTEDRASRDAAFFSALRDQLGLKAESRRAPVPVLVVEGVDRPSEN